MPKKKTRIRKKKAGGGKKKTQYKKQRGAGTGSTGPRLKKP
jgi:hypothetical protein